MNQSRISFHVPSASDGAAVHDLIAACPPLDGNSLYANLLQCTHFADTCILARMNGDADPVGWISGYRPPGRPDVLFVWQVAVAERARGLGLAKAMLLNLLERDACAGVRTIHTTITPDNEGSWRLFRSVARELGADIADRPHFEKGEHFAGRHATEHLVIIGSASQSLAGSRAAE